MKKTLCLILALMLAVTVFAGCTGNQPPTQIDRWLDGEQRTYKISLLTESVAPDDYYAYPETAGVQVKPTAIEDGSYMTYTVSQNNGNWVFDISMTVIQTYSTAKFTDGWQDNVGEAVYTVNGNTVTFTSTMTSQAVFGKIADGATPVSSTKTVKSVVVYNNQDLNHEVAYNDYTTSTTYADGKATTSFTDRTGNVTDKQQQKTVDIGSDMIFDNEAMLLAVRSVDMSDLAEAGSTTLKFFNSTEQDTQDVTVAYNTNTYKFAGDETEYIRIGAVPTGMGYPYYYYCEKKETMAPPASAAGRAINKYIIVRMSQGYMHFDSTASV